MNGCVSRKLWMRFDMKRCVSKRMVASLPSSPCGRDQKGASPRGFATLGVVVINFWFVITAP
ncbi:hypothetical protein HanIR_Chr08g0349301 [Helianthus annuus]|nr:hypothetical protein HanIR_Chr08g0349301 [Helianthus annuus]